MWNSCIVSSSIFVDKAELGHKLPVLRDSLTFRSKFDASAEIPIYETTDTMFGFPRHHFPLTNKLARNMIDRRSVGSPINFNSKEAFHLWDYQEQLLKEFNAHTDKGGTGFFLEAAPGSGKTICAIKFIQSLGKTALVVVPKSDLVLQWIDRIVSSTDIDRIRIATAQNGKLDDNWDSAYIVIALVHTLALDRFGEDFKNYFGTVVFDEVDSSVPPATFAPVVGLFPAKYRIGITATRYRSDGLHKIFEEHLGQIYLKATSSNTLMPSVTQIQYNAPSGYLNPDLEFKFRRGKVLTLLSDNKDRTALIANRIARLYESGRQTLVLSDRKEQLLSMCEQLIETYDIPEAEIGFFMRTMEGKQFKKEYTKNVLENCKIILGTYGMGSRGTDIPRLDALVLATPQTKMLQISGRIERFLDGKKTPVIIDVVDNFYEDLRVSGYARLKYYRGRGMQITYE
jgi:superfamily II DNA or RNA helicase